MALPTHISRHGPWASIDRQAIAGNLAWLKQRLSRGEQQAGARARIWAVVKADAYGHGLEHALAALQHADGLGVATLEDVHQLRRRGWRGPILLLSIWGLSPVNLADPVLGELHVVVDDAAQLGLMETLPTPRPALHAWLRHAGHLRGTGLDAADYAAAFERLRSLATHGRIAAAGHFLHYAASEDPALLESERQSFAADAGALPGPRCTGNSAALCGEGGTGPMHADGHWLRCGLLLYGASALPGLTGTQLGLRPAMSLHAHLLSVRRVKAGQTVGYGGSFRAPRDTFIGVVGAGYGHGVPRMLWQKGWLLTGRDGRRVALAGRCAMDCLTVDLGPDAQDQPGDVMTLWGRSPCGAMLPVEDAALACDTIAAEMLTSLTARVPRVALQP